MKFSTATISKWIAHPTIPEIQVLIQRLSRKEMMEHYSDFQNFQDPVAIRDSITGEAVRLGNGEVAFATLQRVPIKAMTSLLEKVVKDWKGFEDEKGQPIPWDIDQIGLLFDNRLDCEVDNENYGKPINPEDPKSPTDKEKKETMAFWRYLNREASKEDYTPDPKAKS